MGQPRRTWIAKGWMDQGQHHERVYDVALSDGRKSGEVAVLEVGSTVDIQSATYANTIGAAELGTVWTDRDFDLSGRPSITQGRWRYHSRWTTHDAAAFEIPPRTMCSERRSVAIHSSPVVRTP